MDFSSSTPYVSEIQCNLINEPISGQCHMPHFTKDRPAYFSLKDLEHFSSNYDYQLKNPTM